MLLWAAAGAAGLGYLGLIAWMDNNIHGHFGGAADDAETNVIVPRFALTDHTGAAVTEASYRGRWRRHSGMGPQNAHLWIQAQELCDSDMVCVGVQKELLLRRQFSETPQRWCFCLRCRQMKLANPLVNTTL